METFSLLSGLTLTQTGPVVKSVMAKQKIRSYVFLLGILIYVYFLFLFIVGAGGGCICDTFNLGLLWESISDTRFNFRSPHV